MAVNSIDILRDKLYSEADAALRRRIDDRLDMLRQAGGNQSVNITEARVYTFGELVTLMADSYFAANRDTNRNQYVDAFMRKVQQFAQNQREG